MGWDTDRFPAASLDLVCCICNGILEEPVELPCRHIFCSGCIDRWLEVKKTCPQCRGHSRKRDLKPVAPLLKNIIEKQVIYCNNREYGCMEEIPLEGLRGHLDKCPYFQVVCLNKGCDFKVLRKDILDHQRGCPKRPVMCVKGCGKSMPLDEAASHNCIEVLKKEINECTTKTDKLRNRVAILEGTMSKLLTHLEIKRFGSQCSHSDLSLPADIQEKVQTIVTGPSPLQSICRPFPQHERPSRLFRALFGTHHSQDGTRARSTETGATANRRETQTLSRRTTAATTTRGRDRSRSPLRRFSVATSVDLVSHGTSDTVTATLPGSLNGNTMSVHVSSQANEIPSFSASDSTDSSESSSSSFSDSSDDDS